jgi:hypothetical protein
MMQTECWKPIAGYEGLYEVSDLGRIKSLPHVMVRSNGYPKTILGMIRKTPIGVRGGYPMVMLCKNGTKSPKAVHTLVARAFIGPRPPGKEVAHFDGNPANAGLLNLRYATPVENAADTIRHGRMPRGSTNGQSKLTEQQVIDIRAASRHGRTGVSIAADYPVSVRTIQRIIIGDRWRHV